MTTTLSPELIEERLNKHFKEDILSYEMLYDMITITVNKDKIVEILQYLFDDEQLQFRFLTTLCGMHFPMAEENKTYSVVYHLHSLVSNTRIRIKIFFSDKKPEVQSITGIFAAANWLERETYDFYGVIFKGHPDLRRILNQDEMVDFPMRKEFPLEDQTREDKDDTMFGR